MERKRALVWDLVREIRPSRLITHKLRFATGPPAFELIDNYPGETVQVVLSYEDE